MNRILLVIGLFFILSSCDTSSNLEPVNEKTFVKLYGGDGYQYGVDLIQTSDGGYAVAGYSRLALGGQSQFLVLKTDQNGNLEWLQKNFQQGEAVSIVEYDGYLIVGGTQGTGNERRSVVRELDLSGNVNDSKKHVVETINESQDTLFNLLAKVVIGPRGLLVSGNTLHKRLPDDSQSDDLNGFVAELSYNTFEPRLIAGEPFKILGSDDTEELVVGVFPWQGTKYVAVGSEEESDGSPLGYSVVVYNEDWNEDINDQPGIGLPQGLARNAEVMDDEVYILGTLLSSTPTAEIMVINSSEAPRDPFRIPSDVDTYGGDLAVAGKFEFVYTLDKGNIDPEDASSRTTSIALEYMVDGAPQWKHEFGVPGANFAGSVIIDDLGSVVMVGTNDLESQTKVMLIKTGPNGEMNFE